jgi:EAL domain-containing protein (putative c-di-GMP-specific phosphodiesterase class I)
MKALDKPFEIEGLPIAVEISIGIAVYPDHGASADSLIQRADVAMYTSKKKGCGYSLYDPEHDRHSPRRLALLGELRQALEEGQLFLVYQPKIDLQSSRTIGVEALVRWNHPKLGLVPPDQFIIPAEQTGLIKPLTLNVLKEALSQCLDLNETEQKISMAVNISVRNLQDPDFPGQIIEVLRTYGVAPSLLELEITESTIMADTEIALKTIKLLGEKGVRFSIDDFGIGYSSLRYLKRLPVKSIKIDKSFVKDMLLNEGDLSIVRSTIGLAHNLGLKVIAEGVESKETLEKLAALGCDEAQGYYISYPITASELSLWLRESPWKCG